MQLDTKPTYATSYDPDGVPCGVMGARVGNIHITEANRQSVWVFTRSDKGQLVKIMNESFLNKGVDATLYGIRYGTQYKYAIFVKSGFLVEDSHDE